MLSDKTTQGASPFVGEANCKDLIKYFYNIINDIKELNKILSNLVVNDNFNNGGIIYDTYINYINKSSRLYTLYMSLSNNEPKRLPKSINTCFNTEIISELNSFNLYYNKLLDIYEKIIEDLILCNKNFIEVNIDSIDDDRLIRLLKSNKFTLKSLNFEFKHLKTIYKRSNEIVDFIDAIPSPRFIENDPEVYNTCYRLFYISWQFINNQENVSNSEIKDKTFSQGGLEDSVGSQTKESNIESNINSLNQETLDSTDTPFTSKTLICKKCLKDKKYRYIIYLNNNVYAITDSEEKARKCCFNKANSFYKSNHKDFYIMNKPIWTDYNTCIVTSRYRYMFPFSYDKTEFSMNYVIIRDL